MHRLINMNHASELRILETIDILKYTFCPKVTGTSVVLEKKFLTKIRSSVIDSSTSFISRNWLPEFQVFKFSKIHDLRFPTVYFTLKKTLPNVICGMIVEYMSADENNCSICQCSIQNEEKHYQTPRHQNNLKRIDLIPEYLQLAYSNTIRILPPPKPKKEKK